MSRRTSTGSSAPRPSIVHSAWIRSEQTRGRGRQRLQRGHHRFVLLEDEQLLRGVAPPAVRMGEMRHQLRGSLGVHARDRLVARDPVTGFHAVVDEAPDPPVVNDLVQIVLFDARADVGAGPGPLPLLHDPVVHVDDVERAVRGCLLIDGPEVGVRGLDELVSGRRGMDVRQSFLVLGGHAPDHARDRLTVSSTCRIGPSANGRRE